MTLYIWTHLTIQYQTLLFLIIKNMVLDEPNKNNFVTCVIFSHRHVFFNRIVIVTILRDCTEDIFFHNDFSFLLDYIILLSIIFNTYYYYQHYTQFTQSPLLTSITDYNLVSGSGASQNRYFPTTNNYYWLRLMTSQYCLQPVFSFDGTHGRDKLQYL